MTEHRDPHQALAILGGAFNPPHSTHRRLVRAALEQLPVTQVLVLPSGDHPHKRGTDIAPAADRLAMARLCFADLPAAVVDDRELRRSGPSFTVDTLQELADEATDRQLWFLIGSDNLPLLPTWHQHHRLLALASVATFPRAGYEVAATDLDGLDLTPAQRESLLANRLELEPDAVSATDLRARLRRGQRHLPELEDSVEAYILEHHLYET